jgi:hypothetical protein
VGKPVKKEKQLTFRAEPDMVEQLEEIATLEDMTLAKLVRSFLKIAGQLYVKHGSLHALRLAASTSAVGPKDHTSPASAHITNYDVIEDTLRLEREAFGARKERRQKKPQTYRSKVS